MKLLGELGSYYYVHIATPQLTLHCASLFLTSNTAHLNLPEKPNAEYSMLLW